MTRIAYFDTFSGMSGDMALGAMVDAGLELSKLAEGLRGLRLLGYQLTAEKVKRGPFQATRVKVLVDGAGGSGRHHSEHEHRSHGHEGHRHAHAGGHEPHRHLSDILKLIDSSALPAPVKSKAAAVFERLGRAESKIHGIPIETVHFHEVGAVDSIVDVCGVCLGLHLLGVDEVWCSPATVGTGFVRGAHGEIPLPAPATLELLRGIPVRQRETGFELTTPTGAALATVLARGFGPTPEVVVGSVGYGAGDDRPGAVPNVLRVVLGETTAAASGGQGTDRVVLLETSVDDMSPEWIGYLIDRLLDAGALDVSVAAIQMKKSRAAHEIRVLAPREREALLAEILFAETTTFGIRRQEIDRLVLDRSFETAPTPWGDVRIKVGRRAGRVLTASPEHEDVARLARSAGVPLKEVHERALAEYRRRQAAGPEQPPPGGRLC